MTGPEVTQPDPDGGVEMTDGEWAAFRGEAVPTAPLHTAEDVLDARRWFAYSYWERGSGFFVDGEAAENLFDSIASGFTTEHIREWAESMRRADDGSKS